MELKSSLGRELEEDRKTVYGAANVKKWFDGENMLL